MQSEGRSGDRTSQRVVWTCECINAVLAEIQLE
jgi:hypothetical protein